MVCTSPLPSVELPITTPRPRSANAAASISAALAVRPSTMTTTGTSPRQFAGVGAPDPCRLRIAPGGHCHDPGGQQRIRRAHRLAQQPAAVAAQVQHDACGRMRAGEALPDGLRQVAVGAAVELGDLDQQHVAGALREHGLRRDHGALHADRVRASVAAAPGDRELGPFRTGDPAHHGRGVLAPRGTAIDRQDRVAWPDTGDRAGSVGDSLVHHDRRSAPDETEPGACLTHAALAILVGLVRRHVARIRIEVVEQLVEEALHDALRAGPADR